jgi:cobalt-zinc-cadmium efflux system outer membrane protein
MTKTIVFVNITLLLIAVFAQAGYDEMKDEYESYQPSPYFKSQLRPVKEQPPIETENSFEKEVNRLLEARLKWEKVINDKDAFSNIDSFLMESLSFAKSDADSAVSALQDNFTKEILEALVLLRNPSIDSAEKKMKAAIEKISQIANLDEILRQYSAFTNDAMTGIGPMKGKDPIAMKFPFPGVMALKGQVVEKEVEVARLNLEIARREATTSIRKAYWNLLYVRKAREITHEILSLLTYLEEVATTRYEAGKTSYQDVIKVRINRETLAENLKTLKERQKNVEINILSLLSLPGDTRLGKPKSVKPSVSVPKINTLIGLARENRQEILRLHAKIDKMELMVELAETMIIPPFTLNLSLNENNAVKSVGTFNKKESFPVSTTASRGAGLPKNPWYGANDAYLRQTRQKIAALRANLKSLEDKTTMLVRNAWFELDRSKREESLFANTVVELSKTTLDVSTRGYESGKVMFADVFESYAIWFKANLTLERKRSDIGIFLAELERIVGKKLSEAKVKI